VDVFEPTRRTGMRRAFGSADTKGVRVMFSEPSGPPDREKLVELNRRAWNLPSPPAAPAGPARDVWPVRPVQEGREDPHHEDPDAA
jgi:hypothetical protein